MASSGLNSSDGLQPWFAAKVIRIIYIMEKYIIDGPLYQLVRRGAVERMGLSHGVSPGGSDTYFSAFS